MERATSDIKDQGSAVRGQGRHDPETNTADRPGRPERADRAERARTLAEIEQALALRLDQDLEQSVPPLAELSLVIPPPKLDDLPVDRIEERVARAEEQCREADALLGEAIAELAAWCQRAADLGRRLAASDQRQTAT
jgi:hypothetical protein